MADQPRRSVLAAMLRVMPFCGWIIWPQAAEAASQASDPRWALSEQEWKRRLSPQAFKVLRQEGTESPFSSALNMEKRKGIFRCAGCQQALFDASAKFESGTGWPSFYQALPGALGSKLDYKLLLPRTEYHCRRCGGHQGHLFKDGPKPTGLRYCNNGVALQFVPKPD